MRASYTKPLHALDRADRGIIARTMCGVDPSVSVGRVRDLLCQPLDFVHTASTAISNASIASYPLDGVLR